MFKNGKPSINGDMTFTVCELERSSIFKNGKPSISMGHLYHGYVSHNQRVTRTNVWDGTMQLPFTLGCTSDLFATRKCNEDIYGQPGFSSEVAYGFAVLSWDISVRILVSQASNTGSPAFCILHHWPVAVGTRNIYGGNLGWKQNRHW